MGRNLSLGQAYDMVKIHSHSQGTWSQSGQIKIKVLAVGLIRFQEVADLPSQSEQS